MPDNHKNGIRPFGSCTQQKVYTVLEFPVGKSDN